MGSAGDGAELSLAGEGPVLAAPAHLPGTPFLPGCTEPSVCLSKGQGIFLPNPPKAQPALEGFIIMQISWIGSAPAEDSGGARRTELPPERRIEPQIRPVGGWGQGGGGHGDGVGASDVPPGEWGAGDRQWRRACSGSPCSC